MDYAGNAEVAQGKAATSAGGRAGWGSRGIGTSNHYGGARKVFQLVVVESVTDCIYFTVEVDAGRVATETLLERVRFHLVETEGQNAVAAQDGSGHMSITCAGVRARQQDQIR